MTSVDGVVQRTLAMKLLLAEDGRKRFFILKLTGGDNERIFRLIPLHDLTTVHLSKLGNGIVGGVAILFVPNRDLSHKRGVIAGSCLGGTRLIGLQVAGIARFLTGDDWLLGLSYLHQVHFLLELVRFVLIIGVVGGTSCLELRVGTARSRN